MTFRILADVVVVLHVGFVIFVVIGGFLLQRWPKPVYAHFPVTIWGAPIEFAGWVCPLTPLENHLRRLGGEADYSGGLVDHYLLPILYPHALTRNFQVVLGLLVGFCNAVAYALFWKKR